ncbi:MBL fold metallo-hydrolase [Microbacterium sp. SORGH_AS_0888]|uniref:MBL fold metallo-hydrolase n=1 Tax=Microbacterium sp. SORGH_AS_0888 TaxID=3041791 RepID=UPI00277FE2DA|nr:MBL fold metallo-hydrolase [Microbacterium sp. SORGH_AS_0888]MDQ1128360.1 L-ascorbate metabolism protein UlaG (beta-lactamase superfamily) [Microbacterium sp. SORGH_AS_0888]
MSSTATRHALTIQPLGGPTAIIGVGGLRIITDPTFDQPQDYTGHPNTEGLQGVERTEAPALSPQEVGRIDVALVSHDHHIDNLDDSGKEFIKDVPHVYSTDVGAERLGNGVVGLDGKSASLDLPEGGRLTITGVPAQHGPDGVWQLIGPVTGFVIDGDGVPTTYVSGDNSSVDVVREIAQAHPDIEVAILFLGGAGFAELADGDYITLSNERALEVSDLLPHAVIVPIHNDSWKHFREDNAHLRAVFAGAGAEDRLRIVERGASEVVAR